MRTRKDKTAVAVTGRLIKGWPDEFAQDVLELWIVISRLMDRISGSGGQLETTGCAGRSNRNFPVRRKAKAP